METTGAWLELRPVDAEKVKGLEVDMFRLLPPSINTFESLVLTMMGSTMSG